MNSRITADLALAESIRSIGFPNHGNRETKVAFLTGSCGFLGVFLLRDLLIRGELDQIICLVRASDDTQACERLLTTLATHVPICNGHAERIHAIAGDVSKPHFGLSDSKYKWIGSKADIIFHCAAQINLVYPYRHLRKANVLGTYEALALAALTPAKTFHYISSLVVPANSGIASGHRVLENFRIPYKEDAAPGYLQSKWVAEQLVNTAAQSGLPVCIFRPGLITGDSRSGICNPRDVLSLMLRACLKLRVAPDSCERVHLTPVDYVSRAIYELSRQPDSTGKAFHLVNPNYLSWRQISETMSEGGYIDRMLPYGEWLSCLRSRASTAADANLKVLSSLLSDQQQTNNGDPQRFDDINTRKGLAAVPHVRCPDDSISLLITYLQWLGKLDH